MEHQNKNNPYTESTGEIIRVQKRRNNFVMMDKGFLNNKNLSFKAKGLLAYLLSKPDNWQTRVTDLVNNSKDGRDAVLSGLRELKAHGYYKKYPIRHETKKYNIRWESIVYECPEDAEDCMPPEPQTENPFVAGKQENTGIFGDYPQTEKPSEANPLMAKPQQDKPVEENPLPNNIYINKNDFNNNDFIDNDVKSSQPEKSANKDGMTDMTENIKNIIKHNIDYSHWAVNRREDIELIDELLMCIADAAGTKDKYITIGGEIKERDMVIKRYLTLDYSDIELVVNNFKSQRRHIKKVGNYLKTSLYNVKQEKGHHYVNAVAADWL